MDPPSITTYSISIVPVEIGYMYALIFVAAGMIIVVSTAILSHLDSMGAKFFVTRTTVMSFCVIFIGIAIIASTLVAGIVMPRQVQATVDQSISHQIGKRIELHEVIVIDDSIQNGFSATDRHGSLIVGQIAETGHNQYQVTLERY